MTAATFPPGWTAYRVGDVGEVIVGQQKSAAAGVLTPYLRVANVQDGYLNLDDVKSMPFTDPVKYSLMPGDILLCEGQSLEWVGRAALYTGQPSPVGFQNSLIRFRPGPAVLPEYALQVFRTYLRRGVFRSVAKATTGLAHLGLSRFRSLPFPVPPIDLQRELADRYAELQVLLDVASTTISSVSDSSADLVPRIADRLILRQHSPAWNAGRVASSPWPVEVAAEIVDEHAPIVYGILKPGPNMPEGIPYVRGQDLQQWSIRADRLQRCAPEVARKFARSALLPGDVLLGIIRSTRVAIVPPELSGANITQGTARLRPSTRVDGRYLAHWLSSSAAQGWLRSRMRGIDMPGLNLRDIRQLPVPLPPLDIQVEIADQLDALVERRFVMSRALTSSEQLLRSLEAALLESTSYGNIAQQLTVERQSISGYTAFVGVAGKSPLPESELGPVQSLPAPAAAGDVVGEKGVSVPVQGRQTVTEEELVESLEAAGGEATPEELFVSLSLADGAVDAFYVALRGIVDAGRVKHIRPNGLNPSRLAFVS